VARLDDPRDPDRAIWLGLALLDARPRQRAGERVRTAMDEVEVPLLDGHQAVALAAGPTRLRVARDLTAAVDLQAGVQDPVSGERLAWLPAPLSLTVPAASLPTATLRAVDRQSFELDLVHPGDGALHFDPDLFRLDDLDLGPASSLAWTDAAGSSDVLDWPVAARDLVDACHPWEHLAAAGPGTATIRFRGSLPADGEVLEGTLVDGRHATLDVVIEAPAEPEVQLWSLEDDGERGRLQLSPELITNYPNPFRARTQISYRIPATAGEAFLWDEDTDPPFDPQQRLPFAGGGASVTVTVYDLEGREIVTLFTGFQGVGSYQVGWDGKDEIGRTMASGAYFCKLQIENWSVTKRLVFVR
jgi:hypothetical protein